MRACFSADGVEGFTLYSVKAIPVIGVCGREEEEELPLAVPLTAPLAGTATIGSAEGIVKVTVWGRRG